MTLWKIKPLEWEEMPIVGHWRALAFSCVLSVHHREDGRFQAICFPVELAPMSVANFDTFDEAKAAAETFYRTRLAAGLVAVEVESCEEFRGTGVAERIGGWCRPCDVCRGDGVYVTENREDPFLRQIIFLARDGFIAEDPIEQAKRVETLRRHGYDDKGNRADPQRPDRGDEG